MTLSDLDWSASFDAKTFARGVAYAQEGRVQDLESMDAEGLQWRAQVEGSGGARYRCEVLVTPIGGTQARVRSHCACPIGALCKHVAATLYDAQTLRALLDELAGPRTSGRGRRPAPPARAADALQAWERWLQQAAPTPDTLPTVPREAVRLILGAGLASQPPALLAGMAVFTRGKKMPWVSPQPVLWSSGEPSIAPEGGWPAEDLVPLLALLSQQRERHGPLVLAPVRGRALEQAVEHLMQRYETCFEQVNQPLRPGPPRALGLRWEALPDGSQRLRADLDREDVRLLQGQGGWYVDVAAGVVGRVRDERGLASALHRAPLLRPEQAAALRDRLAARPTALALPMPDERVAPRVLQTTPRLALHLHRFEPERHAYGASRLEAAGAAKLVFVYDGERVEADGPARERRWRKTELVEIVRDRAAEQILLQGLRARHLVAPQELPWPINYAFSRLDANHRLLAPPPKQVPRAPEEWWTLLRELAAEGVELNYAADFPRPLREIDAGDWDAELSESGNAWFDLALGIEIEGRRVDLLPILRRILSDPAFPLSPGRGEARDATWRVELDDERALRLPLAKLRALIAPLLDVLQREAPPRLHRSQAQTLTALQATVRWRGDERLRQRLVDLAQRPLAKSAPAGFKAKLRPYQRQGLAWLDLLGEAGIGGVLADDMGLGKTVQVLAHVLAQTQRDAGFRTLVVAPTSLMGNWRDEATRFAPDLRTLLLHGLDRADRYDDIAAHDLILTTYPLLPRDRERLLGHEFDLLVLDEAQAVKNAKSQAAQVVRELRARRRLAMTGTPLENHLGELWAQFDAVEPGLLGSEREFAKFYRTPIEKHGDLDRQRRLNQRIAPLMLRRRKDEVLKDLPPKTEIVRALDLEGAQRDLYESLRLAQHQRVREAVAERGLAQSGIVVLDALLKLRQACCDPRLVKLPAARKVKDSAKLDALLELLGTLLDEGRRVLLFSQFTAMLDLIEPALAKRGVAHLRLDGDTPARTRAGLVKRFQAGEVPLFLISLKAGGVGLNLTAADTVIHYDPWWNPAVEQQATDRTHRIGQTKPVFVYKLICAGTVEEKILALQTRKAELAQAVLEDGRSTQLRFDEADLAELFAPLA